MPEKIIHTDTSQKHPVDRGWAWVILAASQIVSFLYVGTLRSSGIFFVEYVETFKASASMASLVSGIQIGANSLVLLPLMAFGIKTFSVRQCVLVGAVLMSLSYILSSFATSIEYLLFSQSIVFGVGSALVYSPSMVIIGKYFDKRRGIANGLFISSCSLGGLLLPFFFRYVLDEYGLSGAMLLTSGLLLHILVAGSLQRPPEFYLKHGAVYQTTQISNSTVTEKKMYDSFANSVVYNEKRDFDKENKNIHTLSLSQPLLLKNGQTVKSSHLSSDSSQSMSERYISEPCLIDKISKSNVLNFISKGEPATTSLQDLSIHKPISDETLQSDKHNSLTTNKIKSWILLFCDPQVITNPSLLLFVIAFCFGSMNGALAFIFIPKFALEIGVNLYSSTTLVSVIGGTDLIGRFLSGLLSDCKSIQNHHIIILSQTIVSVLMFCSYLCQDYVSLIVFSAIFGLFSGMLFSLYPIMILDILGKEKLPMGLALAMMAQGIAIAVTTPILGLLRDITGTYHATFHYVGSTSFISVVLYLFTPCVQNWNHKSQPDELVIECNK